MSSIISNAVKIICTAYEFAAAPNSSRMSSVADTFFKVLDNIAYITLVPK